MPSSRTTDSHDARVSWTLGQAMPVVFIVAMAVVATIWFAGDLSRFDRISKVVSGLWGALIAAAGVLGVRLKATRDVSFREAVGALPVQLIVYAGSLVLALVLVRHTLVNQPVHALRVEVASLADTTRLRATVTVRGRARDSVLTGQGPWEIDVRAGDHRIVAEAAGYASDSQTVSVRALDGLWWSEPVRGVVTVRARDVTSRLDFSVVPSSIAAADVRIERDPDGDMVRQTTLVGGRVFPFRVPPGTYVVRVSAHGYHDARLPVWLDSSDVRRDSVLLVRVERPRPPAPRPIAPAQVVVQSRPPRMAVLIDGAMRGTTPLTIPLRPGHHRIELRLRHGATSGVDDDVGREQGYHFTSDTTLAPGGTWRVAPTVSVRDLPRLRIRVRDQTPGTYYLETVSPETKIDPTHVVRGFFVFPGRHTVIRETPAGVARQSVVAPEQGQFEVVF